MLRSVVQTYLEMLTERELDAPLLAILSAQGFTDIHFLHGAFEFGKDIIAKRGDAEGRERQYAIQSKAGDLGAAEWRAVRPQLEECGYNNIAHPNFDPALPRGVVLVTTGRLKGSASADAQQFGAHQRKIGVDAFEVWDRDKLASWMIDDPSVGLAGGIVGHGLVDLVLAIQQRTICEPSLERHTRMWTSATDAGTMRTACLETAVLCAALRAAHRLDLAALVALHLFRAAWRPPGQAPEDSVLSVALELFETYAIELLDQVEPLLDDPRDLLRPVVDPMSIVTYPAMACRLTEVISLLALSTKNTEVCARATRATELLCRTHPGSRRPPSDHFAVSVIPAAVVLHRIGHPTARDYLRSVARWVIDRYDPDLDGLGLSSLDEDGEEAAARLLGGSLTFKAPDRRESSYLATVLLDLLLVFQEVELYEAVRSNAKAVRIIPTIVAADEARARWCRGGHGTYPHPRVDYLAAGGTRPAHHSRLSGAEPLTALLLTASTRNRHELAAVAQLVNPSAVSSRD